MEDKASYFIFLLTFAFLASVYGLEHSAIGKYHKVSSWLGHRLVLRDGCPKVPCDPKRSSCIKVNLHVQARYKKCLR